ncbi:hypothetical protein JRQ81_005757 [Phrynocephalus forsythii]|uniref:Reverse transcriptase domain-containing protein n=1 Tax=Phrynocephalus forsythii TaxID=171643 RepID=A0A9Q0XGN6_9SAUR|nr:hypothetical protein JRQ81_005757 [Phrynocephalus forsythii]
MDTVTCDLQNPVFWMLLYVDDVMIAWESKTALERQAQAWSDYLERLGRQLNIRKMEYLMTNPNEYGMIQIDGPDLLRTEEFK